MNAAQPGTDPSTAEECGRTLGAWLPGLLAGLLAGVLGLTPWLFFGGRLPLQNLWREQTLPEDMPWVMLPINQYYLLIVIALLAVGGLFAGVGVRLLDGPRWPVHLGLSLSQGAAAVQSLYTTARGLDTADTRAQIYLAAMSAGVLIGLAGAHLTAG